MSKNIKINRKKSLYFWTGFPVYNTFSTKGGEKTGIDLPLSGKGMKGRGIKRC